MQRLGRNMLKIPAVVCSLLNVCILCLLALVISDKWFVSFSNRLCSCSNEVCHKVYLLQLVWSWSRTGWMHISMPRKLFANMWRCKWLFYMEISLILEFFLHPRWKNCMAAAWLPATLFLRFDFMLWSYLQIQVNSPVDFLKTYVHKWLWMLVQVCIIYTSNMSVAYFKTANPS